VGEPLADRQAQADAAVAHFKPQANRFGLVFQQPYLDADAARAGEFDRVAGQVEQDLA
jgi:hypothetical protein